MNARNLQFTGAYFDGLSARKQTVTVHLSPRQMTLSFPSSGQTLTWSYADCRRQSASNGDNPPFQLEHRIENSKDHRLESLTVDDPQFLFNLRQISAIPLHSSLRQVTGSRHVLLALAVLVIPLFLYGLWKVVIPQLSDQVAMQVPVFWEEKLGLTVLEGLPKALAPTPDPKKEEALKAIVDRLLTAHPNQPYHIRIHISPFQMVNAVALPGGHIIVFQGLLNTADSPEELAGVLAHEIQHVLLRHSTRGIIRALTSQILLTLLIGDMNGSMEVALDVAGELDGLHHSRNMEREADRHGMEMILSAGIDPNGMVRMFEKLGDQENLLTQGKKPETSGPEEDPSSWTEYLSTHPAGNDRVDQLKKQVAMSEKKSYTPLLPNTNWKATVHQEKQPRPGEI
jgi:Zn-dependent protease with chaperone function